MGISAPLSSTPFYTGASVLDQVPRRYQIAINGRGYVIEPSKTKRSTLPIRKDGADTSKEPGEQTMSSLGAFPRVQISWHLGAGQEYFDADDGDRRRFWTSKGVNPWTRYRLSLLNDTRKIVSSANTNLKILAVGSSFYVSDGNVLKYTADPTVVTPTFNDTTINAGDPASSVTDYTTDGTAIYACQNDGIHKINVGTTVGAAHFATIANPTLVQYANGRLLVAAGVRIAEVSAAGTVGGAGQLDLPHTVTGFTWTSVAAAPNGIYMAGKTTDRSLVYLTTVDPSTGGLKTPVSVLGGWPDGETINCISYYGGMVIIGSSRGLRLAVINGDGSLSFGKVVEITGGVKCLEAQGEFMWFGYTNYDGTSTGLGRAQLGQFTEALVPAYATDLMATTQGTVQSAETFSALRYFAVSAVGIYAEFTSKVASGSLRSGQIRFGTPEKKVVTSVDFRHDALTGSVTGGVYNESGTLTTAGTNSTASSLGPSSPYAFSNIAGESVDASITLTRSAADATLGPTLRRWTLRALPVPRRQDLFQVAIIMREHVEPPWAEGVVFPYNPLEEFEFLKALEAAGTPVRFQVGELSYTCTIESVEQVAERWTDHFEFLEGLLMVTLVTTEASS